MEIPDEGDHLTTHHREKDQVSDHSMTHHPEQNHDPEIIESSQAANIFQELALLEREFHQPTLITN